jgi:hypothetical protein
VTRHRLLLHPSARREAGGRERLPEASASSHGSNKRTTETYGRFDGEIRRYLLTPKYPYGVLYELRDDATVYVLAVMHLKRKPAYWKSRQR